MFNESEFAEMFSKYQRQEVSGTNAAMVAGMNGQYFKCDTRAELAAWFSGVGVHCRHIISGGKPA